MGTEALSAVSFGNLIRDARHRKGLSQKDVAAQILKANGAAISAQYLNDIEHDRRHPPADDLLRQLAALLELDEDRVFLAADRVPAYIRRLAIQDPTATQAAVALFRVPRRRERS